MIYRSKPEKSILKDKILQSDNQSIVVWACCFSQQDPMQRVLRHVSPLEVVLTMEKTIELYRSPQRKIVARPNTQRRRAQLLVETQEEKGDLVFADTEKECHAFYQQVIQDHLDSFAIVIEKRKVAMDAAVQNLISLKEG